MTLEEKFVYHVTAPGRALASVAPGDDENNLAWGAGILWLAAFLAVVALLSVALGYTHGVRDGKDEAAGMIYPRLVEIDEVLSHATSTGHTWAAGHGPTASWRCVVSDEGDDD